MSGHLTPVRNGWRTGTLEAYTENTTSFFLRVQVRGRPGRDLPGGREVGTFDVPVVVHGQDGAIVRGEREEVTKNKEGLPDVRSFG